MDKLLGANPVAQALQRRGVDPTLMLGSNSPLQTGLTPGAPNFDPSMQTPSPSPMPDRSPMSAMAQPQQGVPQAAPEQPGFKPTDEQSLIVKTLVDHLKHLQKLAQSPKLNDSQETQKFDQGANSLLQAFTTPQAGGMM